MSNNNGKGREIFYGVIGVATLVVAIIGATFAYFTASASNNTTITGNAATISLSLAVTKVTTADEDNGGMIPMSNNMVEVAVNTSESGNDICVDDTGNAVCQVYKVVLTNDSSAAVSVDGYIALTGGSGETPTDYTNGTNVTDMRWAQVFCDAETPTSCTTAGTQVLSVGSTGLTSDTGTDIVTFTSLDAESDGTGFNTSNILTTYANVVTTKDFTNGNTYTVVSNNYIRVSDGTADPTGETTFDREGDITSALVYSHNILANTASTYYFVVWLSETGTDQTMPNDTVTSAANFFGGVVKFVSAQGNEVSGTFSGYARVDSQASA